eukprot:155398-Chlamydomonas_euryale.AAC.1
MARAQLTAHGARSAHGAQPEAARVGAYLLTCGCDGSATVLVHVRPPAAAAARATAHMRACSQVAGESTHRLLPPKP